MTENASELTEAERLAAWWTNFDGPAYPSGDQFAEMFLRSDWLRERDAARTAALRDEIAREIEAMPLSRSAEYRKQVVTQEYSARVMRATAADIARGGTL